MDVYDVLKVIVQYAIYPLACIIGYIMRKQIERVDVVEKELQDTKIRTSVIESKVDDIRDDIKEIKRNVEKLVERK